MTTFHQQIHIFRFHGQAIPDITPFEHRPSDRGYTLLLDPGVGGVYLRMKSPFQMRDLFSSSFTSPPWPKGT